MTKRIFVLNGHPGASSLAGQAAEQYVTAARAAGHEVRFSNLHDMVFDPDRGKAGYDDPKPLEPVLEDSLANLEWCTHFVLTFPLWWGGFPAKLKGWIDRVFILERTFTTQKTTPMGLPAPLLTGRSARVLITSDTPRSFMWLAYGDPIKKQATRQILGFVGFKPVRFTFFASASHPKPGAVEKLLATMDGLGLAGR